MDTSLFDAACDTVIHSVKPENSIGTLREKTIHAVLKLYISPDTSFHERKVNSFVADIFTGKEIVEIQSRSFNALRRKLEAYLPDYPVTICYPVPHIKYLRWIDKETGAVSAARKSPKIGVGYQLFAELYRIKPYLLDPNLTIRMVLIDVEEYRFLDGWSRDKKKGASRNDSIPTGLYKEVILHDVRDYDYFLPSTLPDEFTTEDYRKAARISRTLANVSLNILNHVGAVERTGKIHNYYLYKITERM